MFAVKANQPTSLDDIIGSAPEVMAALSNTVIGLLRQAGATDIAEALRRNAARPEEALKLVSIPFPPQN